jgi:hypothetical protein
MLLGKFSRKGLEVFDTRVSFKHETMENDGKEREERLARRCKHCRLETDWLYSYQDECVPAHRANIFHTILQEHYCVKMTEWSHREWIHQDGIHCHKKATLA